MKKTLRYLALSSILFGSVSTYSQTAFEVPDNIQLNTREDYVQTEQQIVEAANWLEQTDLDKEADKRQKVNAFIIKWVSGSPTVTINIVEPLSKIYGKNVQLLGIYLASYASYCIGHKGSVDESLAIQAGLVSMMNVYKKGIAVQKTKEMEKIIKMSDLELKEYISKKLMAK